MNESRNHKHAGDNVPLVTVLMTCFNAEAFLQDAIDSIVQQNEDAWELVVVDDGSSDMTREILLSQDDPRIRVILLNENVGIPKALNYGLSAARGKYIARLDADDMAAPHRLMIQAAFMEANPDVVLAGSWLRTSGRSAPCVIGYPASHDVGPQLLRGNRLLSSSVIFRRSTLELHNLRYSTEYSNAQDYEFWLTISQYGRIVILPEIVGTYRYHAHQQTALHGVRQRRLALYSQLQALRGNYKIPNTTLLSQCAGWLIFLRNLAGLQVTRFRLRGSAKMAS